LRKLKALLKYIFEITTVVLISVVLVASAEPAHAQKTSLIRDAEIENTIRQFAAPVLRAAKLNEKAVKIHLVLDDSLNAFVAGGQRLFINTGLITQSASAGQIIGVIAHETGHISGGHLARLHDALNKSSATTIMSMLLGVTAIVAGRGDVGTMIIAVGQGISASNFLKYSRTQESAADHAALRFLDDTSQSAKGLLDFMKKLGEQELLVTARQDPYVRTHPLTRNRVATIANHVAKSPHSDNPEQARPTFARAAEIFNEIQTHKSGGPQFNILSMGMTNDFEIAIEEGGNVVRMSVFPVGGQHDARPGQAKHLGQPLT